MKTDTFDTTQHTVQPNHQRTYYPPTTLTLLSVSVVTFGLVSALITPPVSAKSGRGSSGDSSYHDRHDDSTSYSSYGNDDRHRTGRDDHNDDRHEDRDHDEKRDHRGEHDNREHDGRDDAKYEYEDRDDEYTHRSSYEEDDNKRRAYGQVMHVDSHRFTMETSDGKRHTFKHTSSSHSSGSYHPQTNDYVRVDYSDNSGRHSYKVSRAYND